MEEEWEVTTRKKVRKPRQEKSGFSQGMAASVSDHDGPIHHERLNEVLKILRQRSCKSVLDLGCGEGKFLVRLRDGKSAVEKVSALDCDLAALAVARDKLCSPGVPETTSRDPLQVEFFHGSFTVSPPPRVLERLRGYDAAVLIETIEHLDPDPLRDTPRVLFGDLRPKCAVVTTPNADYNQIFGFSPGEKRHWDHRFEWDQIQFRVWAEDICKRYGYSVVFSGVGKAPIHLEEQELGFCSQFAIFTLLETVVTDDFVDNGEEDSWKLLGQRSVRFRCRH